MKKLYSLSREELMHHIMLSKRLSEKFENYITACEMDWIEQRLALFRKYGNAADWSIGAYNRNYLRVKDADAFLYSVEDSIEEFGATSKLMKLAKQCNKLRGSNLFEYQVEKLCNLYFEEELLSITEHIEGCCYDIYCKKETERLFDYLECFADHQIDDIYVNSNNELVRLDYVV